MVRFPAVPCGERFVVSSMEKVPVSDELQGSAASPEDAGKRPDQSPADPSRADESTSAAEDVRSTDTVAEQRAAAGNDAPTGSETAPSETEPSGTTADEPTRTEQEAAVSGESGGQASAAESTPQQQESPPAESGEQGVSEQQAAELLDDEEPGDEYEEYEGEVEPLELIEEPPEEEEIKHDWYILKVQVNRENTICDALWRRVKVAGLERYFNKIIVPTEEVQEFTKTGKKRIVKRKLYPGYIMVNMAINDDSWFLVRETPGIGDFTGSAGKPTPMQAHEIAAILQKSEPETEAEAAPKIGIKVKPGDRVRVKEGYFQNFEGLIDSVDEANGRVTVIIIFNRSTPVELEHWQVEEV
jgi:transcriptional antiterminator NusG